MSNLSSLQGSPLFNQKSLDNSMENSATSIRTFYSSPNNNNSQTSSPTKKKFVIKSKFQATNTISNFNPKIQSSTSIQDFIDMKPMFLPGKQTVRYKHIDEKNREKTMIGNFNTTKNMKKITSLQNIPINTSLSQSLSPPKKQAMAKLKPLNRHFEIKVKKNQEKLDDILKNLKNDEVDEDKDRGNISLDLELEEKKEEEESSPMIVNKKNSLIKTKEPNDTLNLVNHGLKDETLHQFLMKLDDKIKKIYLFNNSFGNLSSEKLAEYMSKSGNECKLMELDLEETQLTDGLAVILFNNVNKIKNLRILNLTSNFLSHQSCTELKSMIASNNSLKELYLRRNKLTGVAGTNLFQGLLLNSTLKVLDLSWNILTMKSCADAIAKVLRQDSCSLTHLDLSFNNFSFKESEIIANGLLGNHQLYGFHFEGNFGYMNAKGFLILPERCKKQQPIDYQESRRIKGLKSFPIMYNSQMLQKNNRASSEEDEEIPYKDCCWLCDSWHETVFELSLDELSDLPPVTRVFIHLDIDEFHATPMSKPNPKSTKYVFRKVLPPTRVTFFFTVNDLQITSERFFTVKNPVPVLKNIKIGEMDLAEIEIPELNFVEAGKSTINMKKIQENSSTTTTDNNEYYYHPGFFEEIRGNFSEIEPNVLGGKVPNIRWTMGTQLFIEDVKPELQQAVLNCFQMDFENSRIDHYSEEETEKKAVRSILLHYYPQIKDIFHYLSALCPNYSFFGISLAVFGEFARMCNLIDDKNLKQTDVEVAFFTTYTPAMKIQSDLAKSNKILIRCQFIEALVKLAIEKFIKPMKTSLLSEAVERLLLENILPSFRHIENSQWKNHRYLTEKCEIVIKKHWAILEFVFKQYFNKKPQGLVQQNLPGLLYYTDFQALIFDSSLISKSFTEKDLNIAFRLSVGYHVDDLESEINRNLYLNFSEFIEAIARCAEKSGLVPWGERETDMKWTVKLRSVLPLHVKIEALLMLFLKKVCGEKFEKSYQQNIKKSEFPDDINKVFLAQMRGSAMDFDKDLNFNKGKKPENKTFMKNNLQKAINIAILMNKVTRNLMKHEVRQSIDTPYH